MTKILEASGVGRVTAGELATRVAEHMAYCPHSSPGDERAALVIQRLAERAERAEALVKHLRDGAKPDDRPAGCPPPEEEK